MAVFSVFGGYSHLLFNQNTKNTTLSRIFRVWPFPHPSKQTWEPERLENGKGHAYLGTPSSFSFFVIFILFYQHFPHAKLSTEGWGDRKGGMPPFFFGFHIFTIPFYPPAAPGAQKCPHMGISSCSGSAHWPHPHNVGSIYYCFSL